MSRAKAYGTIGVQMSRGELIAGFLFLPLYLLGIPLAVQFLLDALNLSLGDATLNAWIFLINFLAIVLVFRHYLIASIGSIGGHFWDFLQSVVLAFVFYFAMNWVLSMILTVTNLYIDSANNTAVLGMAGSNFALVTLCAVVLAPIIEEVIFRGLFFGNLHAKSRILAYVATILLFSALHVYQYIPQTGWRDAVISAIPYIPAGIALGWAYEKSRTIWAPILVHAAINAVAMGVFKFIY